MTDGTPMELNRQRKEAELLRKRRDILEAPPEKALDMILAADLPATLVQSFSEQDLYFLSHDIGIADALPVLALATSEQWGYMLDVEVWKKDALDMDSVTRWFRALLLADGPRLVRWLMVERLEFFELYLFKNIEVIIREKNQDPSEIPDGFFTVDDWFYVRVKEKPETLPDRSDDDMISQEDLDLVVRELLEKLLAIDHALYQNVMLEAMSVIPAETEEEVFRLRNVRLAEQGFLPFDEALDVYSPLTVEQVESMTVARKVVRPEEEGFSAYPLAHVTVLEGSGRFSEALALLDGMVDPGDFATEFAALCNQIIAADQEQIRERETLGKIVKKAVSFLNIGLEILEGKERGRNAALLMNHSLKNLFRLGVGRVLDLKHRAERLNREGWFAGRKLPLAFWGETWLGVLGGLLVKRPVFFNQGGGGALYREFGSLSDVEQTDQILSAIRHFDDLLSLVSPRLESFHGFFVTYANVLLTVWVHGWSGHGETSEGPVTLSDFRTFFTSLWEDGERSLEKPGVIKSAMKEDFLCFLARRSGLTGAEIAERMGRDLERLFTDIERECGAVEDKDLDPRYLAMFCVVK